MTNIKLAQLDSSFCHDIIHWKMYGLSPSNLTEITTNQFIENANRFAVNEGVVYKMPEREQQHKPLLYNRANIIFMYRCVQQLCLQHPARLIIVRMRLRCHSLLRALIYYGIQLQRAEQAVQPHPRLPRQLRVL